MTTGIIIILFLAFLVWMSTAIVKAWNKGASQRLSGAAAQDRKSVV